MPRLFLLALATFVFSIGVALAHPARPLYMPAAVPIAPPPRPPINLNGTAWQGKYLTTNRIFIFEPDGTLSYKISATTKNSNKNRGTWHVEGDTVTFEYYINVKTKLLQFSGKLQGNALVGESITRTGGKSTQTFTRSTP